MSRQKDRGAGGIIDAYRKHERRWKDNRFVYAVVSRRSHGISIGINLNPGKTCNFGCVYCQVDRRIPSGIRTVDPVRLAEELHEILRAEREGFLYDAAPFDLLPPAQRGIRDIAFSGDGEPTASPHFEKAVGIAVDARRSFGLDAAKIVLITNASCLDNPSVVTALEILDVNNGEVWAKLDAGTEERFLRINRSGVSFKKILANILEAARIHPLVIQSLLLRMHGAMPPESEIEAYCNRLNGMLSSGGRLKALQLYTIARVTAEDWVSPLTDSELDRIAATVQAKVPVPVNIFYGVA